MQFTLIFRRYAPFDEFGHGFEGDNRKEASAEASASARTIGTVIFGPGHVGNINASSSGTKHRNKTFTTLMTSLGRSHSKVMSSVRVETKSVSTVAFYATTAGSNPFIPASPNIYTVVKLTAVFRSGMLDLEGEVTGDLFPNAEVVVYDKQAHGIILFDFHTTGDKENGPLGLMFSGNGKVIGSFNAKISIDNEGSFKAS